MLSLPSFIFWLSIFGRDNLRRLIRPTLCIAAIALLSCMTANAQVSESKQYSFSLMNGKVLPIPGDLPGVCQANVSGWPFAGFALGGVYLPAQPYPVSAFVTIQGSGQIVQYSSGPACIDNGFKVTVTYCISTDTSPCPRLKPKFTIRTKSAVMGVRG